MRITLRLVAPAFLLAVALAGFAVARGERPQPAVAAGDCTADPALDVEEQAFLTLINPYRAQNGRAPLAASSTLSRAAQWKSNDMGVNRYFAHDDLSRTWVQRIRDCGYGYNTYLGENIAAGIATAQQAFNLWRNSSGHNANMLGANYRAIGIGRAYVAGSPYGWYWTTEFGGVDDGWNAGTSTPTPTRVPATATPTRTPTRVPATATPTAAADTTPPQIWTTYTVSGATYYFRAWVADASGIARVEFYVDGVLRLRDTVSPYTFAFTSDGQYHQIRAVAYDTYGNAASMTRTVR